MNKTLVAGLGLLALGLTHHAQAQTANATANAPAYTQGTQSLSQTLNGGLRTVVTDGAGTVLGVTGHPLVTSGGGGGSSAPYVYTPLGYQQITISGATILTPPAGALYAFITIETAPIRYRDDGVAPTATVGYPVAVGQQLVYSGSFTTFDMIAQSGTPVADVLYYK